MVDHEFVTVLTPSRAGSVLVSGETARMRVSGVGPIASFLATVRTCGKPKSRPRIRGRAAGRAQGLGSSWGWGGALKRCRRERGLQEGTAGPVDSSHV
eukprot:6895519-Prymnesium_polylepis.1